MRSTRRKRVGPARRGGAITPLRIALCALATVAVGYGSLWISITSDMMSVEKDEKSATITSLAESVRESIMDRFLSEAAIVDIDEKGVTSGDDQVAALGGTTQASEHNRASSSSAAAAAAAAAAVSRPDPRDKSLRQHEILEQSAAEENAVEEEDAGGDDDSGAAAAAAAAAAAEEQEEEEEEEETNKETTEEKGGADGFSLGVRSDGRMNVLFMMSDDLRSDLSLYGRKTFTPNLQRLSARGVTFDRAYSQVTVCNPSRNSFLSGRTPDVNQVWNFERTIGAEMVTLPVYFRGQGYLVLGAGKIWHWAPGPGDSWSFDVATFWPDSKEYQTMIRRERALQNATVTPMDLPPEDFMDAQIAARASKLIKLLAEGKREEGTEKAKVPPLLTPFDAAQALEDAGNKMKKRSVSLFKSNDGGADQAKQAAGGSASVLDTRPPFMLMVGFHLPHEPYLFPSSAWDQYADVPLPLLRGRNARRPYGMPPYALGDVQAPFSYFGKQKDLLQTESTDQEGNPVSSPHKSSSSKQGGSGVVQISSRGERHGSTYGPPSNHLPGQSPRANFMRERPYPDAMRFELLKGYCAGVTFMDSQLGKVLDSLEASGLQESTTVVFTSDHGFSLGERGQWGKRSLFESDTRVPLIFADPRYPTGHNLHTSALAELVDVFPTLVELAGLEPPHALVPPLSGLSLAEVVRRPHRMAKGMGGSSSSSSATSSSSLKGGGLGVAVEEESSSKGRFDPGGSETGPGSESAPSFPPPRSAALSQFTRCPITASEFLTDISGQGPSIPVEGKEKDYRSKPHHGAIAWECTWKGWQWGDHHDLAVMGYSVRVDGWRYTAWVPWDFNHTVGVWTWPPFGEELYAHGDDPTEEPRLFDQLETVNLLALDGYDDKSAAADSSAFAAGDRDDFDDDNNGGALQRSRRRVGLVQEEHRAVGLKLFEELRTLVLQRRGVADDAFYLCDRIGNRSEREKCKAKVGGALGFDVSLKAQLSSTPVDSRQAQQSRDLETRLATLAPTLPLRSPANLKAPSAVQNSRHKESSSSSGVGGDGGSGGGGLATAGVASSTSLPVGVAAQLRRLRLLPDEALEELSHWVASFETVAEVGDEVVVGDVEMLQRRLHRHRSQRRLDRPEKGGEEEAEKGSEPDAAASTRTERGGEATAEAAAAAAAATAEQAEGLRYSVKAVLHADLVPLECMQDPTTLKPAKDLLLQLSSGGFGHAGEAGAERHFLSPADFQGMGMGYRSRQPTKEYASLVDKPKERAKRAPFKDLGSYATAEVYAEVNADEESGADHGAATTRTAAAVGVDAATSKLALVFGGDFAASFLPGLKPSLAPPLLYVPSRATAVTRGSTNHHQRGTQKLLNTTTPSSSTSASSSHGNPEPSTTLLVPSWADRTEHVVHWLPLDLEEFERRMAAAEGSDGGEKEKTEKGRSGGSSGGAVSAKTSARDAEVGAAAAVVVVGQVTESSSAAITAVTTAAAAAAASAAATPAADDAEKGKRQGEGLVVAAARTGGVPAAVASSSEQATTATKRPTTTTPKNTTGVVSASDSANAELAALLAAKRAELTRCVVLDTDPMGFLALGKSPRDHAVAGTTSKGLLLHRTSTNATASIGTQGVCVEPDLELAPSINLPNQNHNQNWRSGRGLIRVHLVPVDQPPQGVRFTHLIQQGLEKHPAVVLVPTLPNPPLRHHRTNHRHGSNGSSSRAGRGEGETGEEQEEGLGVDLVLYLSTSTRLTPYAETYAAASEKDREKGYVQPLGLSEQDARQSLVVLDEGDGSGFVPQVKPNGYLAYFKRSWPHRKNGKAVGSPKRLGRSYWPMAYSVSDEYTGPIFDHLTHPESHGDTLTVVAADLRKHHVSCTLRIHDSQPARVRVASWVAKAAEEWGLSVSGGKVGEVNTGQRREINKGYFKTVGQAQIIVTCNPSNWEGDFRLWEAMSSGALVFVDEMSTPLPNPPLDGVHLVVYDNSDEQGFLRKLKHYLDRPLLLRRVAHQGFLHALKYHRAVSRVDWILRSALDAQDRDRDEEGEKGGGTGEGQLRLSGQAGQGSGALYSNTGEVLKRLTGTNGSLGLSHEELALGR